MSLLNALKEFGLEGELIPLKGGISRVYRVRDVVLKQFNVLTIENQNALELVPSLASWSECIPFHKCRVHS